MNIKVVIHKNRLPVPGNLQTDYFSPVGDQSVLLLMALKPHGAYSDNPEAGTKPLALLPRRTCQAPPPYA